MMLDALRLLAGVDVADSPTYPTAAARRVTSIRLTAPHLRSKPHVRGDVITCFASGGLWPWTAQTIRRSNARAAALLR